ncbi:MAG TPA: dihydroneopterin aldolase [Candidatus Hydrogenedentes bacterium]|mgnify:CR=1 FL=1|nr:dihydroneopterin aldolase [Candidatus Hydrogenedentota bacterium]
MTDKTLDRIHIRDLRARCIVGINDAERRDKQDVVVNITLYADLLRAGHTDRIEDTVDYKAIKKRIVNVVEHSSCFLIEALAQQIADLCLEHAAVQRAEVTVDKPGALRFARSVAVSITRERACHD